MAITILDSPTQQILPAYNPQMFTASSTETAQPNFNYYVKITDLITSTFSTYTIPARPDGKLVYNAGTFAKDFISQVVPSGYGFQVNTGAYRKIKVNIGESYGAAPVIYPNISDYTYYVWNSVLNFKQYPSYQVDSYRYNTTAGIRNYLTNNVYPEGYYLTNNYYSAPEFTFSGRSNYLYALTTDNGDLQNIMIATYDANGNALGISYIANAFTNSANYIEKYIFIDVGKKGLDNLTGGQVTGAFPVLPSGTDYYDVFDVTLTGAPTPSVTVNKKIKRYYIACEPRYDVITAHYQGRKGQFESFHFSKLSERNSSRVTTTFRQTPWFLDADDKYKYRTTDTVENTLSVKITDKIKLFSDWVTEKQSIQLKDLAHSPLVYLDDGEYKIVAKPLENTYTVKKKYNEKLFYVSMEFQYTYEDFTQSA